jgi:hypothetical protein
MLITTYEVALKNIAVISIRWKALIVDEAHRLKESEALSSRNLPLYQGILCLELRPLPTRRNFGLHRANPLNTVQRIHSLRIWRDDRCRSSQQAAISLNPIYSDVLKVLKVSTAQGRNYLEVSLTDSREILQSHLRAKYVLPVQGQANAT